MIKEQIDERIKKGLCISRTPYGYIKDIEGNIKENPLHIKIIKEVFKLANKGVIKYQIRKQIYKKYKISLHLNTITYILNNPIYAGVYRTKRGSGEVIYYKSKDITGLAIEDDFNIFTILNKINKPLYKEIYKVLRK